MASIADVCVNSRDDQPDLKGRLLCYMNWEDVRQLEAGTEGNVSLFFFFFG